MNATSSQSTEHRRHLVRGTGLVSVLTLLSRVFGFIRDMLVARLFGAGTFADAFFVAYRIPNLLRSFVAEGALTSAFVPVFAEQIKHGNESAQKTFSSVLSLLCCFTLMLTLLGIYFSAPIVSFFAPGYVTDADKYSLTVHLTQVMMPYIICVSIIALLNGALNSFHVYGVSAVAQIVMNVALIIGAAVAAYFDAHDAALILAISVLFGGALQVFTQIPALLRAGLRFRFSTNLWTSSSRAVVKLMVPALFGATIYQISIFINTLLASCIGEGAVSWLFYADRVTQLPIGIFTISLASVLLPNLSRAFAENNQEAFRNSLVDSLRYTSFVLLPISTLLIVLAFPIVEILFQRGAFSADSTRQTALAVQAYAAGLWAVSCHSMLVRGFIAQKDTLTSTIVGVTSLVVGVLSSLFLIGPLPDNASTMTTFMRSAQGVLEHVLPLQSFGHVGLALSSSIGAFFSLFVISVLLSRRVPGMPWQQFLLPSLRILLVCIGMGFCLTFSLNLKSAYQQICGGIIIAPISFILLAKLLRVRELEETLRLVRRTITKGSR